MHRLNDPHLVSLDEELSDSQDQLTKGVAVAVAPDGSLKLFCDSKEDSALINAVYAPASTDDYVTGRLSEVLKAYFHPSTQQT